jgi:hypothetical protein
MKCLDLYSGLGGFSEAFAISKKWDVMRLENNPLLENVAHTEIMDVLDFRDELKQMILEGYIPEKIDLLVASPPCLEFSNGFSAPKSIHVRKHGTLDNYKPDMKYLQAAIDIIEMVKPRYWIIENVWGATRYFNPKLGEPTQIIDAFCLWGNFPFIHVTEKLPMKKEKDKRHSPLRSNYLAQIPLALSSAILTAIETQKTIFDYLVDENYPLL